MKKSWMDWGDSLEAIGIASGLQEESEGKGNLKLISRFLALVTWYIMLPPNQMKQNWGEEKKVD